VTNLTLPMLRLTCTTSCGVIPCQTAGVDALECCELEKKEIGWFAAIDPKDMREDGTNNE
jgi:hypothetical protein